MNDIQWYEKGLQDMSNIVMYHHQARKDILSILRIPPKRDNFISNVAINMINLPIYTHDRTLRNSSKTHFTEINLYPGDKNLIIPFAASWFRIRKWIEITTYFNTSLKCFRAVLGFVSLLLNICLYRVVVTLSYCSRSSKIITNSLVLIP